jgi:hypothetical protein
MFSAINAGYSAPALADEHAICGVRLLASLEDWFTRHVVLPVGVPLVLSLWATGTYLFEAFDYCPYIALVSPTKRCGKTTVLKLLAGVTRRPEFTLNASDAVLFRLIDARRPTLLMDEAEDLRRSSLRAILNAGFEKARFRGAWASRCKIFMCSAPRLWPASAHCPPRSRIEA